ncbi:peptidase M18 [Dipodascopsis tothii]|uniref:peptidase M18 n=1 Tax=Dipodascopsis tothii TaxID=44089 RepID=UPI0034CEABC2
MRVPQRVVAQKLAQDTARLSLSDLEVAAAAERESATLAGGRQPASAARLRGEPRAEAETDAAPRRKFKAALDEDPYTTAFIEFIYDNPTTYHATQFFADELIKNGFTYLSERVSWKHKLKARGKYFTTRNGSALVAFVIGEGYVGGNGAGMVACHIDALCAKVKPISKKPAVEGYTQLGAAPYAGAMSSTWWDRDLGLGGRVVIKNGEGIMQTKLLHIPYPVARIPTLAPHFGAPSQGPFNAETNTTPIIALEPEDPAENELTPEEAAAPLAGKHNIRLLRIVAEQLGVAVDQLMNFDLELFDTQKGTVGGLHKELLFCPRVDDKICSFAAFEAFVETADTYSVIGNGLNVLALFDNEEIGSLQKQGARGGLLEGAIERVLDALGGGATKQQTYANSFLLSADVIHAVNPNFMNVYLPGHMPHLNVGVTMSCDPNGHMTTDAESSAFMEEIARRCDSTIQYFQIRNDSRSGGTVGPMLSSSMGCRGADMGIPQLAMHSIRACTGSQDTGLGVKLFRGFYEEWEDVDFHFRAGEKM